jgi:inosine-uridine nucleoside N-ribohydrolase
MMERIPVLFDTDIGSDIDDAVALAYLLKQPRCELVGITCASGDQLNRARLASLVCRAAGRDDVPIHCGPETSLLRGVTQPRAGQAAALPNWPHRDAFPPATAIEFLRQTIREQPGEITLLSVGPMTNIGLLFATDPELPSLLKDYVLMGGKFEAGSPGRWDEWNIRCDPEAAAIGYQRGPRGMRSVGLDVTMRCQMQADAVRARFSAAGKPLTAVLDLAEVWFSHAKLMTFHDPLAAACVFEPDLCRWRTGTVTVDTRSELVPGLTHFAPGDDDAPHQVAVGVEPERFFEHYFAITAG